MIRVVLELIVTVLLLGMVRSAIGILFKSFFGSSSQTGAQVPRPPSAPVTGALKKDPVCGTFIAATSALQKKMGGQTYYFCSAECRDKFQLPRSA